MSRAIQAEPLCKSLGVAPPGSNGGFKPLYAPPQAGQPGGAFQTG